MPFLKRKVPSASQLFLLYRLARSSRTTALAAEVDSDNGMPDTRSCSAGTGKAEIRYHPFRVES